LYKEEKEFLRSSGFTVIVESGIKHHNSNPIVIYLSTIYHNEVRVIVFNATFNNISQRG
jgi:hypothetical protein